MMALTMSTKDRNSDFGDMQWWIFWWWWSSSSSPSYCVSASRCEWECRRIEQISKPHATECCQRNKSFWNCCKCYLHSYATWVLSSPLASMPTPFCVLCTYSSVWMEQESLTIAWCMSNCFVIFVVAIYVLFFNLIALKFIAHTLRWPIESQTTINRGQMRFSYHAHIHTRTETQTMIGIHTWTHWYREIHTFMWIVIRVKRTSFRVQNV